MPKLRTLFGAALCAASGLFVTAPATAGGLGPDRGQVAPSLRPPVITEVFKPVLPCNENTTIGLEGCGERQVLGTDGRLDGDVKAIFGLLRDAAAARSFVTAETTWLTYRNQDCTSQSDVYQGGSEQPVAYVHCLAADDVSRRQDLKGFFEALAQGRATVPRFP